MRGRRSVVIWWKCSHFWNRVRNEEVLNLLIFGIKTMNHLLSNANRNELYSIDTEHIVSGSRRRRSNVTLWFVRWALYRLFHGFLVLRLILEIAFTIDPTEFQLSLPTDCDSDHIPMNASLELFFPKKKNSSEKTHSIILIRRISRKVRSNRFDSSWAVMRNSMNAIRHERMMPKRKM